MKNTEGSVQAVHEGCWHIHSMLKSSCSVILIATMLANEKMRRTASIVLPLLLVFGNGSFAQAGDCNGLIAQANSMFEAYRASVRAVARATGGSDYEPYCSALEDALQANEAADAATRSLIGSGCKTDAEKNVALIASDKGQIREGIPLCLANLEKQRAERDAKSRESTVGDIIEGRRRTNAGLNDIRQPVAPIESPPRVSPTPSRGETTMPTTTKREVPVPTDKHEGEQKNSANERTPDCSVADVWPNLGRCIRRKADRLRKEGLEMLDADKIFPNDPGSDDPFSGK